ncbi:MAG TPA: LysM domain-containing protein [Burkholderiaceae bacterium]|nr:LysM domain-containing protein [Burkholderiaceae bacterium]
MLKKSITWVIGCAAWLAAGAALAQPATAPLELSPDAPDTHVVARGDTLWDISARFLKTPWRWPELWQLNREQIANPHLIYPGDVVYLDRSGAQPRLRLGRPVDGATLASASGAGSAEPASRLEPMIRSAPLERSPIPTMNLSAIQVFLNRPLVIDEQALKGHPRIVASQENRVYLSRGDLAYVRGLADASVTEWHVYRPARPLIDPATRQPIAFEALYVGSAQLVRGGDPATVRIQANNEEIGAGDRLMPAERQPIPNFAPRPPERPIEGRIVSVHRGVDQIGKYSVVALSAGRDQGLEVGNVLAVQQAGRIVPDREDRKLIKLPDEPVGQVMVFRVFDRIAYALVVHASLPISVGASVVNP